jgi:hypothetical protein
LRLSVILLAAALWPLPALAQVSGRESPGPYVIDVRGATSGIPTAAAFYPPVDTTVAVPSRALGFDIGGHVYLPRLGAARLGLGASFVQMRGTSPAALMRIRLLAPQVSLNFGSGNGWSHLSAGIGTARIDTELRGEIAGSHDAESGSLRAVNVGGGARWFLTDRAAVGFDLRFHRVAAGEPRGARAGTPHVTLVTVSVGVSVR